MLENKSVEEIPALSREKGPISVVVVQALVYPQWVEFDFEGTSLFLFLCTCNFAYIHRGVIKGKADKAAALSKF